MSYGTDISLATLAEQRAKEAWVAMPSEVRIALHRRVFQMNPINAIKEVGAQYRNGVWSITPYPGASGFAELGLKECVYIHDRLCERDD